MEILDLGDVGGLRIHVHDEERFSSPHTGRDLRRLTAEATTHAPDRGGVLRALKADRVPSVDAEGNRTALWQVQVPQHSISNGVTRYVLELTEVEDLDAEQVVLGEKGEFELRPYAYDERAREGDGLQINLKTRLVPEETERLFEFRRGRVDGEEYFPVVRRGISDEPRRMRFGWGRWSRHDGEEDKVEIILVEDRVDEADPSVKRGFAGLADNRARGELAYNIEHLAALLDLLEEKGILSEAERETLSETAHERTYRRYLDFSKVEDLDEEDDS